MLWATFIGSGWITTPEMKFSVVSGSTWNSIYSNVLKIFLSNTPSSGILKSMNLLRLLISFSTF